jgi:transcriptional regulator
MDITLRNEEILKMACQGYTLQEIVNIYGTTTQNISTLLSKLGYKKKEIIAEAKNTLLVNQEIINDSKILFSNKIQKEYPANYNRINILLEQAILEASEKYKTKHNQHALV